MEETIDLFRNKRYNRALFDRIRFFLQAAVVQNYLFFELFIEGSSIPEEWFRANVFCSLKDPNSLDLRGLRIKKIITKPDEPGHLLIMTERLPRQVIQENLSEATEFSIATEERSFNILFKQLLAKSPQTA